VAIGSQVETSFSVGDEVVATPDFGFASHLDLLPRDILRKPACLSLEQASAYLLSFGTAWYALCHLARIRRGESILIHSATGGLGMSAIQIARQRGLTIFATAGSEDKRRLLRESGIEQVFDSRTTDFAEKILELTAGRGVDAVLNSLSGARADAGLSVLAFGGRFLEVGKTDIYSGGELALQHFRRSISYFALDMASLRVERPEVFRGVLEEVSDELESGRLTSLPIETFPASEVRAAFERMARASHVGKIVVRIKSTPAVAARALPGGAARSDGVYLISGGLGALGRATAEWLLEKGARRLVLIGRSEPNGDALSWIADMRARGALLHLLRCDVANLSEL
jgi:NADPH:quinone reductase-like Zn-dependent oxidoreductase